MEIGRSCQAIEKLPFVGLSRHFSGVPPFYTETQEVKAPKEPSMEAHPGHSWPYTKVNSASSQIDSLLKFC